MSDYPFVQYRPDRWTLEEMSQRATAFCEQMSRRRSVRQFSSTPVPRKLVEQAIRTASTAPSGANRQPWTFAAVSDDGVKRRIRDAAEAEERESYEGGRMSAEMREAVAHFETDWRKPFLEIAPWLVVAFERAYELRPDGTRKKNYYVKESVGLACGLFVTAIHNMGLATLPHTPSPMGFLSEILGRPMNERPFILFPIGYPADDALVPDQPRKELDEVSVWVE